MPVKETKTQEQPQQQSQELATLGDGAVFVKRTETGLVKAVKAQVRLDERKGHLAEIQGKVMITGAGYNEMNKVAGVSVITPEKLTLPDGSVVVNPYPIIEPVSGSISKVWVKKMAIGLSPIGNLVITTSTLLYDIQMYFIQDLVKKIKYSAAAGRLCMESMLTDQDRQKGIFCRIEGELGVWADFSNKDVLTCIETFVQNKLFAERKAQTIAERNAMKKHPALATTLVIPTGPEKARTAVVNVVGFSHDFSQQELLDIAQKAADGEPITVNNKKVEVMDITGEASEEDLGVNNDEEENAEGSNGGDLL
jgi:hypothetical protein